MLRPRLATLFLVSALPLALVACGGGGSNGGVEFSGAVDFGQFADVLKGFGVQGSLSLTKSNLNPTNNPDPTQEVRIPGLSGTVYNVTGYYERGGFQARISQRYRSAFKGEVVQLFATRGFTEILADKQVDAQIGYTFNDGPLENLGILLQVNNLTDSPYRTRLGLDGGGQILGRGELAAVLAVGPDEVGVAEGADGLGPVLLAAGPQVAAGKAAEHGGLAGLAAFTLQGEEDFLDGIGHREGSPFPLDGGRVGDGGDSGSG